MIADRLGHDRRYSIDGRKIEQALGYRTERTLAAGLRETLDWYLAHDAWWRKLLKRS